MLQTFSWLQYSFLVVLRIVADVLLPFLILWTALKVIILVDIFCVKLTLIDWDIQGRRVMHLLKIRLPQCWICRRCFPPKTRDRSALYYGEEMMSLGTPI